MEKSTWIKQTYTYQLITMDEPHLDFHSKHIKAIFYPIGEMEILTRYLIILNNSDY